MTGWDDEFGADRPRYDRAHEPGDPAGYRPPIDPYLPPPPPADAAGNRAEAGPPQGGDRRQQRPPRRRQGQKPGHAQGQGQGQGHPHARPRHQHQNQRPRPNQNQAQNQNRPHDHGPRPGWEGPVGFAQKIAREFSDAVRSRGQSYFLKNRVAISASSPGEVVARVKGTAKYKVRLRLRGDKLVATCSCPYFSPFGDPCKHLWATVLAADARGLLPGASVPMRPLRLVTDVPKPRQAYPPGAEGAQGPLALPLPDDSPGNGPPSPREARFPNGAGRPQPPGSYRTSYGPAPVQGPGYGIHGPAPAPGARGPNQNRNQNRKDKNRRARAGGLPVEPIVGYPYTPGAVPGRVDRRAMKGQQAGKVVRNTKRMLAYILDVPATLAANQVVIELARRLRKPNGDWSELKVWRHSGTPTLAQHKYDPEDEDLLALLTGAAAPPPGGSPGQGEILGTSRFTLKPERQAEVVEALARTERLRLRRAGGEEKPPVLKWVPAVWRFGIDVRPEPPGKRWTWRGILRRRVNGEDQRIDLNEPLALLQGLVILGNGRAAPFDDAGVFLWMMRVRHEKEMVFNDAAEMDRKLSQILSEAKVGPSALIEGLKLAEVGGAPRPSLTLRTPRQSWGDKLSGELEFIYSGEPADDGEAPRVTVPAQWNGALQVLSERGVVVHRDESVEQESAFKLFEMGFRETKDHLLPPGTLELPAKRLAAVTKELVALGWKIEAEGSIIHAASEFKLAVTTGIDWFELGGAVDFGGQSVPLPDLLAAARRGETMIELGDGSMGMLPEEWLKKYGLLADLGTAEGEGIRFGRAQAGLLDALIAAQPEIKVDMAFGKVRKALPKFEGLQPREAPAGFRGELRPYQREGLGWLDYLQKFDFGGILADDMGLGKTVQVLALLQSRRARRQAKGPSLIVVPRSLVFNWMAEAERFTPRLRVLDYTGPGRHSTRDEFDDHDLIITTYGTMRTDIADLCQREFDYVILDEAQAIKNADSQSAKAARLLKGRHRLAMTGTPIENHLGELWSIFEFLNPGMLGTAGVFKRHTAGVGDEGSRALLARALRPFILRRTKAQVVQDLPDKLEQTLTCDMEPAQRQVYEELKAHYRAALLRKGEADLNRSKIEVLEALLRLRQAACHPGLIDPSRAGDPSAKLEMLLPQLAEVVDEGHKVLIFSQFTSFLSLVRERLDSEGITYEYLDGKTRDRAARVERFQTDPSVPVFLISLKAGGLGLNLTAADYVYLLDPWWNPAVEAQAIDRSHRIGQTQRVFAYRLICRDTVEQKILDLQQKKRDLADAILNADSQGMIAGLTRDDIEFLLS